MRKLKRSVIKAQYSGRKARHGFAEAVKADGEPFKDKRGNTYQRFINGMLRLMNTVKPLNKDIKRKFAHILNAANSKQPGVDRSKSS